MAGSVRREADSSFTAFCHAGESYELAIKISACRNSRIVSGRRNRQSQVPARSKNRDANRRNLTQRWLEIVNQGAPVFQRFEDEFDLRNHCSERLSHLQQPKEDGGNKPHAEPTAHEKSPEIPGFAEPCEKPRRLPVEDNGLEKPLSYAREQRSWGGMCRAHVARH